MEALINLNDNCETITFTIGDENYKVRLQGTTETPYFCGKDICKVLGYTDIKQAIRKHVKPKHKCPLSEVSVASTSTLDPETPAVRLGVDVSDMNHNQLKAVYISEPGLYSLILQSRAQFAEKFQDLVYEQILPSIRKFGSYNLKHQLSMKESELESAKRYALTLKELIIPDTKRDLDEVIYISTSQNYARQNRFKIGGVESMSKLKNRLSQYNCRSATGDEWYFSTIFKVANYRECERRICDIMNRFRDKKHKEIYIMHYNDLYGFVRFIIEHYEDEINTFNETITTLIANLDDRSAEPVVPEPCGEMNEITITRVSRGRVDNTLIDAKTETVLKQRLKEYLDTLPSGTVVTRTQAIDELEIKKNKRCFWKWLKDLIPSYPSLYLKY